MWQVDKKVGDVLEDCPFEQHEGDLGKGWNDTINMGGLMLIIYIHLKIHWKNIFDFFLYLQIQEFVKGHVRINIEKITQDK